MAAIRSFSVLYSLHLITTTTAVGNTYELYGSDDNFECSNADSEDICILHCDPNTAGSPQFNCGLARDCYFYCEDKQCLRTGILNATSSQNLHAYTSVELCYENANVYTAQKENYFESEQFDQREFKKIIINGGNSESIFINCTSTGAESCRQMIINAQSVSSLEIVGGAGIIMQDTTIYCPQNSDYNGPNEAPCFLDFSDGIIDKGNFYTLNGIPQDIMGYGELQNGVTIWCGAGSSVFTGLTITHNMLTGGISTQALSDSDCFITSAPTTNPTTSPTKKPNANPTTSPTQKPTANPSFHPTYNPTKKPTTNPTMSPTKTPSTNPTSSPTANPSTKPTAAPSLSPTKTPTVNPAVSPTKTPSVNPTLASTKYPTLAPTLSPTKSPSSIPTLSPTKNPSTNPTFYPSSHPSSSPTVKPSVKPTAKPSLNIVITAKPTVDPTASPIYGNEGHVVEHSTETHSDSMTTSFPSDDNKDLIHLNFALDIETIIILVLVVFICLLCVCLCVRRKKKPTLAKRSDEKSSPIATDHQEEWWTHKKTMFDVPSLRGASSKVSNSIKNVALQLTNRSNPYPQSGPHLNPNFTNMNVNILPYPAAVNTVNTTAVIPVTNAYDFSALSVPNTTGVNAVQHVKKNTNLMMEGVHDNGGNITTNNIALDIVLPNHILTPDSNKPLPRENVNDEELNTFDTSAIDLDEVINIKDYDDEEAEEEVEADEDSDSYDVFTPNNESSSDGDDLYDNRNRARTLGGDEGDDYDEEKRSEFNTS